MSVEASEGSKSIQKGSDVDVAHLVSICITLKCEISFVLRGKKKCILQNFTEIYTYVFKPQALFFFFLHGA